MMMQLTDDEWKQKLTPEKYASLRQKATEAPFTGKLLNEHGSGEFVCGACGAVVFKSDTKFESGSGWPSFYDPANTTAIILVEDNSHGMVRTEVTCANCGSHLGHMFEDAVDQPTGKRYCINSSCLQFMPQKTEPKDS